MESYVYCAVLFSPPTIEANWCLRVWVCMWGGGGGKYGRHIAIARIEVLMGDKIILYFACPLCLLFLESTLNTCDMHFFKRGKHPFTYPNISVIIGVRLTHEVREIT
jgi:hypothetical protein